MQAREPLAKNKKLNSAPGLVFMGLDNAGFSLPLKNDPPRQIECRLPCRHFFSEVFVLENLNCLTDLMARDIQESGRDDSAVAMLVAGSRRKAFPFRGRTQIGRAACRESPSVAAFAG